MNAELRFVYVTASSEDEAMALGRRAVEARLAACANVLPGMRSVYWWEGKIDEGREAVLIL
ncbi:MAG: divalent-cation tolerance protein CutA, partial [Alphaproteobacteria bacterium]|nr:divalent-cation tolerance protein CutA [Alphaproteobacteria bacterium]